MSDSQVRINGPEPNPEDGIGHALRPQMLADFIGQNLIKENLDILIVAAKQREEALDHVLLYGPPGLGKTSMAHILSNEMVVNIKVTAGPAIERAGDLAAILTNLRATDILFIDEIHRLGRAVEEILYPAMEDFALDIVIGKGPAARSIRLKLPRFTVIGRQRVWHSSRHRLEIVLVRYIAWIFTNCQQWNRSLSGQPINWKFRRTPQVSKKLLAEREVLHE